MVRTRLGCPFRIRSVRGRGAFPPPDRLAEPLNKAPEERGGPAELITLYPNLGLLLTMGELAGLAPNRRRMPIMRGSVRENNFARWQVGPC